MIGASGFRAGGWLLLVVLAASALWPLTVAAAAPSPLRIEGDAASFALDAHLWVFEDHGGRLGIDDVVAGDGFRPLSAPGARPGLDAGTVWYRFTVRRAADQPDDWVLAFGEPDIDDVRMFVVTAAGLRSETQLGRRFPSGRLPLAARRHVANLGLTADEPTTVYLRLSSERKLRFEAAALWRPGPLMFAEARDSALAGLRFGALAVVAVVYALFGLWMRDAVMLLYALYVGTILGRGIVHTGLIALLFPSAEGSVNHLLTGGGLLIGSAAFVLMWDRVLDLARNFPRIHRVYRALGFAAIASLPLVITPAFPMLVPPAHISMLVSGLGSIVIAGLLLRRSPGDVPLRFYFCAFPPVVLAWGIESVAPLSATIPPDLGRSIDVMAINIHVVILAVALAYRLQRTRSERLRAEAELAGERLARQRLRTFIDMAAHEFKTPLAVVDSAAQMIDLLAAPVRPDIAERLASIRRAVRRLVDLIETCLASERDTELALDRQPVTGGEIVEGAAERNRDAHPAGIVVGGGPPGGFMADAKLLGIALDALIDNARRYGAADQPIEVRAEAAVGGVAFIVADRGPGIAAEEAERVFEKYYRGTASGSAPGTGIGLHLVKTIAELHGGRIHCRPRGGGGAEFVLTVPV